MKKITLFLTLVFCYSVSIAQTTATYNIQFTNHWNATDHNSGSALPGNAHWSDLVITNHNNNVTFFEMNGTASPGVELIAELGSVSTFQNNDYQNAFNANNAQQFVNAGSLFLSSGTEITYNGLQVSEDFPYVTVLSMIAPSPDWFVGLDGLNLRNGGNWQNSITIDLFPYDAGTEEGTGYSISNSATSPQETIQSIQGVAPFNNEKVATITFTLQSVLSTNEESIASATLSPNPVKDYFSINSSSNLDLKNVEIYTILGSLKRQIPVNTNSKNVRFNVSNLNSGIYLVKLNTVEGKSKIQKIVVK
ncbi:T9SS type A sorting domain-containing protein [Seonamhaeicola marinus]|uniref:T9SS type A sorting domain-containing protein n=1 Tax=Seonamhaeicola marinus TaxID=1912246 RepID=A0A5D0HJG5_9FLAO|nr:spondin domain-containing protein [Seonamhaeicola marinus]TYA71461.1 T9SS type A sorting domain-containing protein [Seonamhaeicola marinus]